MKTPVICLATLATLSLISMAPPGRAPVAVGPGGVVDAVTRFLDAIDAADQDAIQKLLGDADHGVDLVRTEDGGFRSLDKVGFAAFVDLSAAGQPVESRRSAGFHAAMTRAIHGGGDAPELVETHIRAVHADCPSGDCSWAVVDFERVYRSADGSQVRVPMCASALLSYRDGGFHLFHWHASRAVAR